VQAKKSKDGIKTAQKKKGEEAQIPRANPGGQETGRRRRNGDLLRKRHLPAIDSQAKKSQ